MTLSTNDHDRGAAGMRYVYPVLSRRAKGVSVGINLNPNNACNWRCIYCQVPDLSRGAGPAIDMDLLRTEVDDFLSRLVSGDYLERHLPPGLRRINDVAFSGNGESTTSPHFLEAVEVVISSLDKHSLLGRVKIVLITNGSQLGKAEVQEGLRRMASARGEIWFKVDTADESRRALINGTRSTNERVLDDLVTASQICPTRIQSCFFALDGKLPGIDEQKDFAALVVEAIRRGAKITDVLLYGLARESQQSGSERLSRCDADEIEEAAERLAKITGIPVVAHP